MKLLLDTHIFLWWTLDDPQLSGKAKSLVYEAEQVFVSAASIWEIALKARTGKLDVDPHELQRAIGASGFLELPITPAHAVETYGLPSHHKDPFDRLLVAQALSEPLRLLTVDHQMRAYSDLVILA